MAAWKLSKAAERLRNEVNKLFPDRDKRSDGSVGDLAHSNRVSDHNPDADGWVRAIDIDEDVWGHDGQDPKIAYDLVKQLIKFAKHGEYRLKYIIFEGKIWSQSWGWSARKYSGENPHNHHIHVSFNKSGDNDGKPFGLWAELRDEVAATPAKVKKGRGK